MQASPWGTGLNKKLMSCATEAVTAPFSFVSKLNQHLENVIKSQTEIVKVQTDSFNEHVKEIGEIYSKAMTAARC
jgi:hypothetical protein